MNREGGGGQRSPKSRVIAGIGKAKPFTHKGHEETQRDVSELYANLGRLGMTLVKAFGILIGAG